MTLPSLRLWFLDEFGIHLAMSRANARAPRGERAVVVEPLKPAEIFPSLERLPSTRCGLRG
jgi:hypothetical protein